MVPAGRRSGKTEIAKRRIVRKGLTCTIPDAWIVFAAPTRQQAKRLAWPCLKKMVPSAFIRGRPIESDLILPLVNGCDIQVMGLDEPARIEGRPLWHVVLDEFGNMKPQVWHEHVRPALADLEGTADFIGVPEGRNHYYDLYLNALDTVARLREGSDWAVHQWSARTVLSPREIESLERDLDELTARQEIDADFVEFQGTVYYGFNRMNVINGFAYDATAPLIFALDFNVSPGTAAVIQVARDSKTKAEVDVVIGEVWIERDSNTPRVCEALIRKFGRHRGRVLVYGDATGGAAGTAKVDGSDWDLVRKHLGAHFGDKLEMHVARSNPQERVRINSVNSRLKSLTGERKLYVVQACKNVIKDFEGVRYDKNGKIDKNKDKMRSHVSDGIGYYIHKRRPLVTLVHGRMAA